LVGTTLEKEMAKKYVVEITVESRFEAEIVTDVIGEAEGEEIDFAMGVFIAEKEDGE
jgi:hypothetical protein